jgi:hypothetical protein
MAGLRAAAAVPWEKVERRREEREGLGRGGATESGVLFFFLHQEDLPIAVICGIVVDETQ